MESKEETGLPDQNLESQSLNNSSGVDNSPELVIVTGMSGAGRTEAIHALEDLGYYCVDNLPSPLIGNLLQLAYMPGQSEASVRIAVVCDARNKEYYRQLESELKKLKEKNISYRVLFLDADDEKLISRYKSSRRRHPLCTDGSSIATGIIRERALLFDIRESAHIVIDTTKMLPPQLKDKIKEEFSEGKKEEGLSVTVYSFGFKHNAPADADIVMDVRFLPNPYYEPELKKLTGLDIPVKDFVLLRRETQDFMSRFQELLDCLMPGYVAEGKNQLAIAIGCTGGQHRSVAIAEEIGYYLKSRGYFVSIAHRDLRLANKQY